LKIELVLVGKHTYPYIESGLAVYEPRIRRYNPFELHIIPHLKQTQNLPPETVKLKEGELILKRVAPDDYLILLDERGKMYDSEAFAAYVQSLLMLSKKKIVLVVGGAYGFSEAVYARADAKLSLSKMTFSHQMIRLFVVEQIYRAFAILNNEPYHNA
jgi:23S rRNA (pseudouridine1915-N3)-methyltransferase